MTVGLPGAGIGGIFYLASAILMPIREAVRLGRGSSAERGRLVVRQSAIAVAILAALWATGWMLGHVITLMPHSSLAVAGVPRHAPGNVLRVAALLLGFGTLTLVLTAVQVARFVVRPIRGAEAGTLVAAPVSVPSADAGDLRVDSGTFGRAR